VALHQFGEVLGAALLLTLDHDPNRGREWFAVGDAERPQRRGVDRDPGLVIGRAPSEEPAVTQVRLERWRRPFVGGTLRLHVVVGVEEHGGSLGWPRDLPDHRGVPAVQLEQPGVGASGGPQDVGGGLGAVAHDGRIEPRVPDRRDPDQAFQVGDRLRHVGRDAAGELVDVHGESAYRRVVEVPSRPRGTPGGRPRVLRGRVAPRPIRRVRRPAA
jgi:hypothetical protein